MSYKYIEMYDSAVILLLAFFCYIFHFLWHFLMCYCFCCYWDLPRRLQSV